MDDRAMSTLLVKSLKVLAAHTFSTTRRTIGRSTKPLLRWWETHLRCVKSTTNSILVRSFLVFKIRHSLFLLMMSGHRILQTMEDDVKAKLKEAGIQGERCTINIDENGDYNKLSDAVQTMKYTVDTKIRSRMDGPDWVITSEWQAPSGQWMVLARRTINIGDSLSIECITTQIAR
jgi:hypothetical protein